MSAHPHCRRCGKPLPDLAIRHRDPFCSTRCAQAAYGVKWSTPEPDADHQLVPSLPKCEARKKPGPRLPQRVRP